MKKTKVLSGAFLAGSLLIALGTTNQQNVQAKNYSYKVITVKKAPYAQLYDNDMEAIPQAINDKSDWRVGKTKQVDGTYYYQVADDEWVNSSDVKPNFDKNGKVNSSRGNTSGKKPTGYSYKVHRVIKGKHIHGKVDFKVEGY